jgi:hypothetical protein
MHTPAHGIADPEQLQGASTTIETTLYDLVEAISSEVEPGEEDLITATLVHLLNSGRVKFCGDPRNLEVVCF